ncbi:MAG TPA: energy transducer TonB [Thermoanaerobaculia bacterium]|nr:energy transducer TonB [Thermoanaerobaculia bacterium]
MVETRTCIRCGRPVDAEARSCPFCNQEQVIERLDGSSAPVTAPSERRNLERRPEAPPVPRRIWQRKAGMAFGVGILMIVTFAVGGIVYAITHGGGRGSSQEKIAIEQGEPVRDQQTRGDFPELRFAPDPTSTIGRAVTTHPVPDPDHKVPNEYQRSDATALPSREYSGAAASRSAEEKATRQAVFEPADPRTITTPLTPLAPTRPRAESTSAPNTTPPVPISQPLPGLNQIRASGTISLRLRVGPSGNVQEVEILEGIPGATERVVSSVRSWRFRPATRDGQPVAGSFRVNIILGQ